MDAAQLQRWVRFAAKGGIGRGTALVDFVAEQPQDLMFLKGDEIVVLMKLENERDVYLGHCEDVVGRFLGAHVRFHGKLKMPVRTKRSSLAARASPRASSRDPTPLSPSPSATSFAASGSSPSMSPLPPSASEGSASSVRVAPSLSFASSASAPSLASPITPHAQPPYSSMAEAHFDLGSPTSSSERRGVSADLRAFGLPAEESGGWGAAHASKPSQGSVFSQPPTEDEGWGAKPTRHAQQPSQASVFSQLDESRSVYSQPDDLDEPTMRLSQVPDARVSLVRTASVSSTTSARQDLDEEDTGSRASLVRTASLSTLDRDSFLRARHASLTLASLATHSALNGGGADDEDLARTPVRGTHAVEQFSDIHEPDADGQEGADATFRAHTRDASLSRWAAALASSHRRADSIAEDGDESRRMSRISAGGVERSRHASVSSVLSGAGGEDGAAGYGNGDGRASVSSRNGGFAEHARHASVASSSYSQPPAEHARQASIASSSYSQGLAEHARHASVASTASSYYSHDTHHAHTPDPPHTGNTFNTFGEPGVRARTASAASSGFGYAQTEASLATPTTTHTFGDPMARARTESAASSAFGYAPGEARAGTSNTMNTFGERAERARTASAASSGYGFGSQHAPTEASVSTPTTANTFGAHRAQQPSVASSRYSALSAQHSRANSRTDSRPASTTQPHHRAQPSFTPSISSALAERLHLASPALAPPAEDDADAEGTFAGIGSLMENLGADSSDEDDASAGSSDVESTMEGGLSFPQPPISVPLRSPPWSRPASAAGSAGARSPPGSAGAAQAVFPPAAEAVPPVPPIASPPPTLPSLPSLPSSPPRSVSSKRSAASLSQNGDEEDEEGYWDGASDIYDDYRYSRFSMLSRASKKSARSAGTPADELGPPAFPDEFRRPSIDRPPFARRDTADSARSLEPPAAGAGDDAGALPATRPLALNRRPAPLTVPVAPDAGAGAGEAEPAPGSPRTSASGSQPALSPLLHGTFSAQHASTGSLLAAHASPHASTGSQYAVASPLLHTTFGSPLLHTSFGSPGAELSPLPAEPLPTPVSPHAAPRTAAGAVRQRVHAERQMSDSTVASDGAAHDGRELTAADVGPLEAALNKDKAARLDAPLIVMNPAPAPPPYATASTAAATFNDMPAPVLPPSPTAVAHAPLPPGSAPQLRPRRDNAHDPATRQSLFGSARTSVFAPHPNAPKPVPAPAGPMYGRVPLPLPAPAAPGLVATMRAAAAGRVAPNGARRAGTVYGATAGDLLGATGPVRIAWSLDPPNDVPANRIRRAASEAQLAPSRPASAQPPPVPSPARTPSASRATSPTPAEPAQAEPAQEGRAIPRMNFFPKAGTARPRSRSFSGFESPFPPRSSSVDASAPKDDSVLAAAPAPTPASNPRVAGMRRQYSHTPSPLALQQTTASAPTSPLIPPSGSPRASPLLKPRSTLTIDVSSPLLATPVVDSPTELRSPSIASPPPPESPVGFPRKSTDTTQTSPSRRRRESERTRRTSGDTDLTHISEVSGLAAGSPRRSSSLRSKLSFSALRGSSRDGPSENGHNTVQVQDLDFELVMPAMPALPAARNSEDSAVLPRPSPSFSDHLRADSPAVPRSPLTASPLSGTSAGSGADSIEAHRQRELKWVSLLGTTKPADAAKNRKVRRLLQEGVPASVRSQVWGHLSDSRSRRLEGLYAQLCSRGRVAASADIERDVRAVFGGDSRLADPGALVKLLQAYLVMVPDVQYQRGLVCIAGQLLMQSPEEDAFWIFISLMDTHLRPYFAMNSTQLEVDAALFARALESADPVVGKRLFTDYSIPPVDVVRPWFTSLFVEALPTEYFQRVWDIFLAEGVVFLFRTGLALLTCTRRALLDSKGAPAVLALLARPPAPLLARVPPDAFADLALNARGVRDDDVRKLRVKMEADVRRRTQHARLPGGEPGAARTISLPSRA